MREALTALDKRTWVAPSKLTVSAYLEKVWLPMIQDQDEDSTWESYERNVRLHVMPHVGGIRLQELAPQHLNELYRRLGAGTARATPQRGNRRHEPHVYERILLLRDQGLPYRAIADQIRNENPLEQAITGNAVARIVARASEPKDLPRLKLAPTTVRYIHTIVSGALTDAVKLGLVTRNVTKLSSPPRPPKARPQRRLWTGAQTQAFLDWARDLEHRLWAAWVFVATSGDRRGANLGLHWSDVDLDAGLARLVWTVTAVRHRIVVKPYGKTGAGHEILLDAGTISLLRWWRARQAEERVAWSVTHDCPSPAPGCGLPGYHRRDLVFCRPDGDYLHPERFTREFQRAQARYNRQHPSAPLPVVNLHALRHGWATLALEAGVPMKVVQDRLDHASERITADLYTQVREPLQSDAANRVAELSLVQDFQSRLRDRPS